MNPIKVFVASSTEGKVIAKKLQRLLKTKLGRTAVVELWWNKFAYSDTAIESLESVAEEADFAVLVMTGDDITVCRKEKIVAPRDNLVFELGLFIGALGRERAFVARNSKSQLKLPSDILGVTTLIYNSSTPRELADSLRGECLRLAAQMAKDGSRPKWLTRLGPQLDGPKTRGSPVARWSSWQIRLIRITRCVSRSRRASPVMIWVL